MSEKNAFQLKKVHVSQEYGKMLIICHSDLHYLNRRKATTDSVQNFQEDKQKLQMSM